MYKVFTSTGQRHADKSAVESGQFLDPITLALHPKLEYKN
jgi:hypothetical protein